MKSQERHRERNDEIAALWIAKHRASAIAWKFGISRDAVLGVVGRRGLLRTQERSGKHAVVNGGGAALERLARGQCRYPLGKAMDAVRTFCGLPVFLDKPYCLAHCRLCYPAIGGHVQPE